MRRVCHDQRRFFALAALPVVLGAAATIGVAHAAGAPPPGPAPKGARSSPPPAWVESGRRAAWLAYGSYCWTTACVDFIPPSNRTDIPVLLVSRGALVSIHLTFQPRRLAVTETAGGLRRALPAKRVAGWRPRRAGLVVVEAAGAKGDASYLVKLRLLP